MSEPFVKHSPEELGEALENMAGDQVDNGEMLETLVRSKAFTLLDRPWPGSAAADDGIRLINVEDPRGECRMLGLFTSAEKAEAAKAQSPAFEHLARVEVVWALLKLEEGTGVLLNPADDKAFRIPPDVAANLKQAVQQAIAQ